MEDFQSVHPSNEAWQGRLSWSGHTDQEEMTLWLAEDSIDAEDIIENLIEEDERNVELLLIEDLTRKKTTWKLTNIFSSYANMEETIWKFLIKHFLTKFYKSRFLISWISLFFDINLTQKCISQLWREQVEGYKEKTRHDKPHLQSSFSELS